METEGYTGLQRRAEDILHTQRNYLGQKPNLCKGKKSKSPGGRVSVKASFIFLINLRGLEEQCCSVARKVTTSNANMQARAQVPAAPSPSSSPSVQGGEEAPGLLELPSHTRWPKEQDSPPPSSGGQKPRVRKPHCVLWGGWRPKSLQAPGSS